MIAGVVVALVAIGAVAWVAGRDGGSTATQQDDDDAAGDSTAPDATPAITTAVSDPASTVDVTLPATASTIPTVPASTAPPTTVLAPSPPIPAGAVLASDPAGWVLAVDPAWNDTITSGARTFFVEPGATSGNNVNVTTEQLPAGVDLDGYIAAAIDSIRSAASDFEIVAQRREVGADGTEIELIGWSGTLAGLPKLSFLQAVTVSPTTAYIATFTSQPGDMSTMAPFLEPFLITLRGA